MRRPEYIPTELIDPDGEGIYLLVRSDAGLPEKFGWPLIYACELFGMDIGAYHDLQYDLAWMEPGEDDHWEPANTGRFPPYWRLNLPRRWRPVMYSYLRPPAS